MRLASDIVAAIILFAIALPFIMVPWHSSIVMAWVIIGAADLILIVGLLASINTFLLNRKKISFNEHFTWTEAFCLKTGVSFLLIAPFLAIVVSYFNTDSTIPVLWSIVIAGLHMFLLVPGLRILFLSGSYFSQIQILPGKMLKEIWLLLFTSILYGLSMLWMTAISYWVIVHIFASEP